MPDYSKAKIYTLRNKTDNTLVYVGSTVEKLSARFSKHKSDRKTSISNYILNPDNKSNWDEWYIELYELYPCSSKEELKQREGQIQREIGTINTRIENRTREEWYEQYKETKKEYDKNRYEDNKEIIAEKAKIYREKNKEKLAISKKIYYENNKEILEEKAMVYRQQNKEKKAEYDKEYRRRKKENQVK